MRIAASRNLRETPCAHIESSLVVRVSHMDGTKRYLQNDDWALLRFSGTEPLLRLVVEADSADKARELIDWLRQFAVAAK